MDTDRRNEITASVAAHQHLGPGYEQAVAEGLVERISTEIDDRITRQIDDRISAEVDDRVATGLDQHLGCRHVRRASRRARRASRRAEAAQSGRPSILLILGSFVFAMSSTAIVLARSTSTVYTHNGGSQSGPGATGVMLTALIWIIVGLVNVAYVMGVTGLRRDSDGKRREPFA
jgi:hypothetical protein